ncbi:MAG TPA: epoxide hydrolase N-terminal domain-containing protein, partial [Thiobacillaceae bacterium]|nr:epoxide hydrolase N-terminal domain-containing protein [Thiobacillaceae bacterium]
MRVVKELYTTKAHTTGAFSLLSRFLVVLFAATVSLASSPIVLGQQPAQSSVQPQSIAGVRTEDGTIRSFHINVPEEQLVDLRRRIAATRWPDRETVNDQSQGIPLAKLQELVRYWGTGYDWRKAEARLNALPQFVTTIDG